MDARGMMPDGLEAALSSPQTGRALVYVTPTLHNPTTACMDSDRVHAIAQLCRRFDALVIEDGVYAGQSTINHTLAALIPERTFHVSSLSKIISPGLRIGALAPPQLHSQRRHFQYCLHHHFDKEDPGKEWLNTPE